MITQSLFQDKNNKRAKEKEMRGGRHRRLGKKSEQEAAPTNTDGGSRLEISVVVSTFSCHKCLVCGFDAPANQSRRITQLQEITPGT